MKKKKMSIFIKIIIVLAVIFVFGSVVNFFKGGGGDGDNISRVNQEAVLVLELKGVLIDKPKFLKHLRQYSQMPKIRGVLIRLDSPGGSVALSQEIYQEFKRIRLKKPVVVSVGSTMASGALYAAVAASHILVQSGTLVGSIGVIFPLVNMERLYEWAKIEPYSIKTGEFKDSGTRFRPMTAKERVLFQDLVNELLAQFQSAIIEGRKMRPEELDPYMDARVFTGETAVSAGFADSIGTFSDAIEVIGELSGLGIKPKLFTPQPSYLELLSQGFGSALKNKTSISSFLKETQAILSALQFYSSARPMYIFPPAIGM